LTRVLADDSVIVADGGDFVSAASYVLRPRRPLSWLDPGPFGTLGAGAGFALGAKLVRPSADVWIVYGDGSVGYSLAEADTFARHGVGARRPGRERRGLDPDRARAGRGLCRTTSAQCSRRRTTSARPKGSARAACVLDDA
jgi:hypothetical protein